LAIFARVKNFLKILRLAANYKGFAFLNILFNILSVFFNVFSLGMLIPVMDVLFKTDEQFTEILSTPPSTEISMVGMKDLFYYNLAEIIASQGKEQALIWICITLVGMTTAKNLFKYFAMFFLAKIRNNVVRDLRNSIYHKILRLPIGYFSEERKGDVMAKAGNDVQEVEWSIMASLEATFREPIAVVGFLTVLFLTSVELTLFIFILLPVAGLVIGQIGKSLKKTSSQGQHKMGELLSILEETLSGMRIIKAFNAEESSRKRFERFNQQYTDLMVRMYRKRDLASPLSEWMGIAVVSAVLLYGGGLVFTGELEASFFIGYLALFSQVIPPVKALSNASYHVQKGSASMDRINDILNAEVTIKSKENAVVAKGFKNDIVYKNVSFRYDGKTDVLKGINMRIQKGQTIALVGASGGGKSTLADLLARFHDVHSGGIEIDGVDIRDLQVESLRSLMGVVTQQSILFNDTVANNIAFGTENAAQEAIEEAAKIANAHEFITKLAQGYETNIGDGGGKLSGGQRQRLSIARAILKNPPILILDEATSALDTESEKLVQDALNNLMQNRTSIVIAHRLSTIQQADCIYVIDQGEVVEQGTHQELLQLNKIYRKLSDLQSFK
jgi:subfamily B ATP-binding cassette protein MsbA